MTFFSANLFANGEYAHAKRGTTLVRGTETTAEKAAEAIRRELDGCDAVLVGAGAGLSTAAGFSYSGKRFDENFADFRDRFGITDMYSGGFHPFPDLETYWAWWSRAILLNRYEAGTGKPYLDLLHILEGRDYFVLTTNVDHQFQLAEFDKARLFYTQGDYGLFQCSEPCCKEKYDNEEIIRKMLLAQGYQIPEDGSLVPPENGNLSMRIPSELVPYCPHCGKPMSMNLRADDTFVEDKGWHEASSRRIDFLLRHNRGHILYLELGVGYNTPGIIKYPFFSMTAEDKDNLYVCINTSDMRVPDLIRDRAVCIKGDIGEVLDRI